MPCRARHSATEDSCLCTAGELRQLDRLRNQSTPVRPVPYMELDTSLYKDVLYVQMEAAGKLKHGRVCRTMESSPRHRLTRRACATRVCRRYKSAVLSLWALWASSADRRTCDRRANIYWTVQVLYEIMNTPLISHKGGEQLCGCSNTLRLLFLDPL